MSNRLYEELAAWWPLLAPPEDYADEASLTLAILAHGRGAPLGSLLELGSGAGQLALHMPADLDVVLLDLSPAMLAASRAWNPGRTHVQADMRDADLGRRFDAVLLHDAVMYLLEPEDLAAACATAARHLVPGGAFLVLPDVVEEDFREGHVAGGAADLPTAPGRAARMLEWHWDPVPGDGRYRVDMAFLLREADGTVRCLHDVHTMALRSRAALWAAIRGTGLTPVEAPPHLAARCGEVFLARKPLG
ncbi:class I SAM-dependent methyltransferase [Myxococcota bacterium]|nr:class I SAM-dependent methyltransferase [Myxococcota bacterium]